MTLVIRKNILTAASQTAGIPAPPADAGYSGTLTTYSGPMTITASNTLIENKIINGMLLVRANNVTIRNCLINAGSNFWGIDADGEPSVSGMKVDHTTIRVASYSGGNSCVLTGNNWQVTSCDLSGFDNGIMCQSGTGLASGNFIHALGPTGSAGEAHVDGIQLAGGQNGVVIEYNWIESWDTSDIIIKADFENITNIIVRYNTLIIDGNKGISVPVYAYSVGSHITSGVQILYNRMQRGNLGYVATDNSTPVVTGNVDYITGNPVS